ncbi:MAG: RNA-binding transcriptional accessory protein [Deltaproteobacteria bacterium]|nr:RNA-binding transcriptional accessory protein [Deltaproteobacteria bacterium]
MPSFIDLLPQIIAEELLLPVSSVARTLELVREGATIPFMARYRKEVTGGLDEVQLGAIKDRFEYLTELEERRQAILSSLTERDLLTDELAAKLHATRSKTELEDLYLPFKPKRRTRATIARERGLEPLADLIWGQASTLERSRDELGLAFVDAEKGVLDREAAFQGARDIVAERIADEAEVRAALREQLQRSGKIVSRRAEAPKGKKAEAGPSGPPMDPSKFSDYFEFDEAVAALPSHRILALRRGEKEGALRLELETDRDAALAEVQSRVVKNPDAALRFDLQQALVDSYDRLLRPSIAADVNALLKERADLEAIKVFAENLRHLLLAAPFGLRPVIAVDPGFRTGCKVVALDATGKLLEETVIYPHEPHKKEAEARAKLAALAAKHGAVALAIGNGTAGRETEGVARAMLREGQLPEGCAVISVNESGASVYSASEIARQELPDHDVTVRGAVSIGRRLQDPLAELVKIDPKSIGVGQYQHDVSQPALKRSLDGVVESCVNAVGVEVNTASVKLLSYVAGIGETVAENIIRHRSEHGAFRSRRELLKVPRLGPKAFEQAAGFLRIRAGGNPLDGSGVHPESYDVVERMAQDLGVSVAELVGQPSLVSRIPIRNYIDERRGEPTLRDILAELEKPGRDPRAQFEAVGFREDVTEFEHLQEGMVLQGVVTNVTKFGAFVDVGVHQDGLVHVSELSHRFVKEPSEVVKVGDRVQVKVVKVDKERRRIGLSIKQTQSPTEARPATGREPPPRREGAERPASGSRSSGRPGPGGGNPQRGGPGGGGARPAQNKPAPFNAIRIRPPR